MADVVIIGLCLTDKTEIANRKKIYIWYQTILNIRKARARTIWERTITASRDQPLELHWMMLFLDKSKCDGEQKTTGSTSKTKMKST
jgi:hypothetical protein